MVFARTSLSPFLFVLKCEIPAEALVRLWSTGRVIVQRTRNQEVLIAPEHCTSKTMRVEFPWQEHTDNDEITMRPLPQRAQPFDWRPVVHVCNTTTLQLLQQLSASTVIATNDRCDLWDRIHRWGPHSLTTNSRYVIQQFSETSSSHALWLGLTTSRMRIATRHLYPRNSTWLVKRKLTIEGHLLI